LSRPGDAEKPDSPGLSGGAISGACGRMRARFPPEAEGTLRAVRRIFGGAALIVAGIAAFIEAHAHPPVTGLIELPERGAPSHLSHTAYDLLRIAGWALVICGVLLVVVGLIAYVRRA
jgi:hypothetical protein